MHVCYGRFFQLKLMLLVMIMMKFPFFISLMFICVIVAVYFLLTNVDK